jgi:hypothetical protein
VDLLPLGAANAPRSIRALRLAVTREEAVKAFNDGLVGGMRRLALGPLRLLADVYVPFRLYQVTVGRGRRRETAVLGVDGVTGALDFYRFDVPPGPADLMDVCTRNHVEPVLVPAAADEIVASRVQRMMYGRVGFVAAPHVRLEVRPIDRTVHVPYWVGFFGRREAASLVVMDAVRRQIEGVKVRRLIGRWLSD